MAVENQANRSNAIETAIHASINRLGASQLRKLFSAVSDWIDTQLVRYPIGTKEFDDIEQLHLYLGPRGGLKWGTSPSGKSIALSMEIRGNRNFINRYSEYRDVIISYKGREIGKSTHSTPIIPANQLVGGQTRWSLLRDYRSKSLQESLANALMASNE